MGAEDTDLGEAVLILSTDNNGLRMGIDDAQTAAAAMQAKLDEMQDHIKGRFAERFEHAGLFMFSRQLFGLAGLGDVARHTMGAITLGMDELATAAGTSTAALAPLLLAAGAAIVVFEKVTKGHKETAESLEQLQKKQADELATLTSLKEAAEKYKATFGALPPDLAKLMEATEKLDQAQRRLMASTGGLGMKAAQDTIAANQIKIDSIKEGIAANSHLTAELVRQGVTQADLNRDRNAAIAEIDKLTLANKKAAESYELNKNNIKALGEGFAGAQDKMEKMADKQAKATEQQKKAAKELTDITEALWKKQQDAAEKKLAADDKIAAQETKLEQLTKTLAADEAESTTNAQAKKQAAIQKYHDEKMATIMREYQEARLATTDAAQVVTIEKAKTDAINQLNRTVAAKTFENYGQIATAAAALGKTMSNSFADTAAKSIASGKSMHDGWIALSAQVKEQVIADGIKMGIEFAVQAIKGEVMHDVIGAAAVKSAAVQVAANGVVIKSNAAKAASVDAIALSLVAATKAAAALDIALGAAV